MGAVFALIMGNFTGLLGSWLRSNTSLSSVGVSSVLTLGAGIILPWISSQGYVMALVCTSVSYVVMSDQKRLTNQSDLIMTSSICSLLVYYGQNLLVGVGGRLGTFAAISVIVTGILKKLKNRGDKDVYDNICCGRED